MSGFVFCLCTTAEVSSGLQTSAKPQDGPHLDTGKIKTRFNSRVTDHHPPPQGLLLGHPHQALAAPPQPCSHQQQCCCCFLIGKKKEIQSHKRSLSPHWNLNVGSQAPWQCLFQMLFLNADCICFKLLAEQAFTRRDVRMTPWCCSVLCCLLPLHLQSHACLPDW